jgi:diguanylate cyclase (GGDEF)-like protein
MWGTPDLKLLVNDLIAGARVLDWTKIPDVAAVAFLTCAFASVARRGQTRVSRFWLTGWELIAFHFALLVFVPVSGMIGTVAGDMSLVALVDAGVLFMYSSVPYRDERSSRLILISLLATNSIYVCLLAVGRPVAWALIPISVLLGALPLTIALFSMSGRRHFLRWTIVALYAFLAIFLLFVHNSPEKGSSLALNGVLCTVYLGCSIHFWFTYRRATTGAFITIAGFFTWASVFVIGPWLETSYPGVHLEGEVWNLPKYVVAVGMILLLLEDQLEHNKYLALHDELTGLPNRRLFLDRLGVALERARRTRAKAALLVVDLDRFKEVNDTLGHHAGDLLLQQVGKTFLGRVRTSDTVARTGGDEFSVILENTADNESAHQVAKTLLANLNEPLAIEGKSVWVGASVGVAIFPDDAGDIESLCIAADLRMYDAKNGTRDSARRHHSSRILPQSVQEEPSHADLHIATERVSA